MKPLWLDIHKLLDEKPVEGLIVGLYIDGSHYAVRLHPKDALVVAVYHDSELHRHRAALMLIVDALEAEGWEYYRSPYELKMVMNSRRVLSIEVQLEDHEGNEAKALGECIKKVLETRA